MRNTRHCGCVLSGAAIVFAIFRLAVTIDPAGCSHDGCDGIPCLQMFQQVESLSDALSTYLGISEAAFDKLVLSVFLVLVLVLLRRASAFVLERRLDDPARRYIATKTVDYLLGLISVLVLLRIWLGGLSGLAASIGIVSAGLAIALYAPLTNLAGWIFLAVRRR